MCKSEMNRRTIIFCLSTVLNRPFDKVMTSLSNHEHPFNWPALSLPLSFPRFNQGTKLRMSGRVEPCDERAEKLALSSIEGAQVKQISLISPFPKVEEGENVSMPSLRTAIF